MAVNYTSHENSTSLSTSVKRENNISISHLQPTPKLVQKIVTVGGKQVILTGSASSTSISAGNSLKRSSLDGMPVTSPMKVQKTVLDTARQSNKQIVSILPSSVLASRKKVTSSHSYIKSENSTSPVKLISVNSSTSPQKILPASGTVYNFSQGTKTIKIGASSGNASEPKAQNFTLSPQKLYIKGQPVNVQFNSQKTNTNVTHTNPNIQPVPISGSKLQYVRLVTNSQGQQIVSKPTNIAPTPSSVKRSIAPALSMPSTLSGTKQLAQNAQVSKSSHPSSQRLILPATSQVQVRAQVSSGQQSYSGMGGAQALTHLPPGTTIISSGGQNLQGVQGFALVPAQYVHQLQQSFTSQQPAIQPQLHQSASSKDVYDRPPSDHSQKNNLSGEENSQNSRARKPCNCTKSQCLKLYCECFANGEFCCGCNCANCYNNLEHEDDRARAIKQCLDRNPHAFRPKIGKDRNTTGNRRHNKGCNCKRSGCLKNYCECYEAKILCTHLCKCVGCKNFDESPDKKTLMHLADAAEVRVQQQTAAKSKFSSQMEDFPLRPTPQAAGERLPYSFVTSEVAEATCSCLVAQAEECERTKQIDIIQEKLILEEFGRCLMQVIESANKTKESSNIM